MSNVKNILLVGQVYFDKILYLNEFPEEDTKVRANKVEQRIGGNTCNTAKVLSQFKNVNLCYMSAVGSHDSHILDNISLNQCMIYRENAVTPFSIILYNEKLNTRTIISNSNLKDICLDEFIIKFNMLNKNKLNDWWVHFEGRNIKETSLQIDWLIKKSTNENWRNNLIISIEIEKPERENINSLVHKSDILFFSKNYAEYYKFNNKESFLKKYPLLNELKKDVIAFCTWGSLGAAALKNNIIYMTDSPKINQVVDTVGAGDTFIAGIILSLSNHNSNIQNAIDFASHLATKKVAQQGFDHLNL